MTVPAESPAEKMENLSARSGLQVALTGWVRKIGEFGLYRWAPYLLVAIYSFQKIPDPHDIQEIARRSPDLFVFPLGPSALLGALDATQVVACTDLAGMVAVIGLVAFALPHRATRICGGLAYTLAVAVLLAFNYASGKIDHQFLVYGLPGLIVLDEWCSSGTRFVRLGLFFYFTQSCLTKATGGWLSPDVHSLGLWLQQYEYYYWSTSLGTSLLEYSDQYSLLWNFGDLAVVIGEGAIACVFLLTRRLPRTAALLTVSIFHISIDQMFGIGFTSLFLLYWWALQDPVGQQPESFVSRRLTWLILGIAGLFLVPTRGVPFYLWIAGGSVLIHILEFKSAPAAGSLDWLGFARSKKAVVSVFVIANCFTVTSACLNHETFPGIGGPMFAVFRANEATEISLCKVSIETLNGEASDIRVGAPGRFESRFWGPRLEQYLTESTPGYGESFACPFHSFEPVGDSSAMQAAVQAELDQANVSVRLIRKSPTAPSR